MRPGEDHLGGFLSRPLLFYTGYHTSHGPRRIGMVHSELVTSVGDEVIVYLAGWLARACSGGSVCYSSDGRVDASSADRYVWLEDLTVCAARRNLVRRVGLIECLRG